MGRKRKSPGERRKKVNVKLLERKHGGKITTPYKIMEELIQTVKQHAPLRSAKIAIAWSFGKKDDVDGRMWLGQAKKGSDLDRAMHGYDFVILLNHEVWNSGSFTEQQMTALLDHELCHCATACDSNGQQKIDEENRKCWRIRKHDVEEFKGIMDRRGPWKDDVREFVEAAQEMQERPLLAEAEKAEDKTGRKPAKPSKNGKKGKRFPARIKLTRDIIGCNTPELGGMMEHVEYEVIDWVNDKAVVRDDDGKRVQLPEEAYAVLRWADTEPSTAT